MLKINLEHNISSLKIPQLRLDQHTTVLGLKEQIQKRYGSQASFLKLTLKKKNGDSVAQLNDDYKTLTYFGAENDMTVYIQDINPNSIHRQIEDLTQVQKYKISQQDYSHLPLNFRKWKTTMLQSVPSNASNQLVNNEYMGSVADTINVGNRARLENGVRGNVRFVGKVPELGPGYWIGLQMDQGLQAGINAAGGIMNIAFGGNGTLNGNYYFLCSAGKAVFVRPDKVQCGDFPIIEQSDQI